MSSRTKDFFRFPSGLHAAARPLKARCVSHEMRGRDEERKKETEREREREREGERESERERESTRRVKGKGSTSKELEIHPRLGTPIFSASPLLPCRLRLSFIYTASFLCSIIRTLTILTS